MRNTNLWSIIGCISLLLLSFGAQAQNLFVIEGKVKNVKQGVCLNLFQMEGSVVKSLHLIEGGFLSQCFEEGI